MGNKEGEEFYLNLSKKELQCLCKKYGLSPHKTKFNLVKSLVSYLQKKTLTSISSCVTLSCEDALRPTSFLPQRQLGSQLNCMVDGSKDSYGIISEPREEVKEGNHLQALRCSNMGSCTGAETYDKIFCSWQATKAPGDHYLPFLSIRNRDVFPCLACLGRSFAVFPEQAVPSKASCIGISEGFGCTVYNHRETSHKQCACQYDGSKFGYDNETPKLNFDNNKLDSSREGERTPQIQSINKSLGASTTDHALVNPMTSSTKVHSSFEFYVRSEEGIKLCVDLNSSPSDWSARLTNGLCTSHNVPTNKSRSLHQTLGRFGNNNNPSLLLNTDSSLNICDGIAQSRSSPSSTVIENGQDGTNVSLRSSALRPCSGAVDLPETWGEDQAILLSSGPSLNIQGRISGTESYPRDEGTLILNSDVSDILTIKPACEAALNLASAGARSLDTLKHLISEVNNGHCENSTLHIPCSLVNTGEVVPGCFTSKSLEVQLLEVASTPKDVLRPSCDIKGFLYRGDPTRTVQAEQGALVNPSMLNHNACSNNLPTSAEELSWSGLMHRRARSECQQYDNSIEKGFVRCDLEFSERLQKKRQWDDSQDNCSSGNPDAKMFKSSKQHTDEVFPRRSMRLIAK